MKELLKIFNNNVLAPSYRKLSFLYVNLCQPEEGLLTVGTHPDTIEFGNPEEAIGIIQFKNKEKFNTLWNYLEKDLELFSYPYSCPVYNLGVLQTLIKKYEGKTKQIKKKIIREIENEGYENLLGMYILGEDKKEKSLCVCLDGFNYGHLSRVHTSLLAHFKDQDEDTSFVIESLKEGRNGQLKIASFKTPTGENYKALLLKGVEYLNEKKPFVSKTVFWKDKKYSLLWCGGYCESEDIRMVAVRGNVFIML